MENWFILNVDNDLTKDITGTYIGSFSTGIRVKIRVSKMNNTTVKIVVSLSDNFELYRFLSVKVNSRTAITLDEILYDTNTVVQKIKGTGIFKDDTLSIESLVFNCDNNGIIESEYPFNLTVMKTSIKNIKY